MTLFAIYKQEQEIPFLTQRSISMNYHLRLESNADSYLTIYYWVRHSDTDSSNHDHEQNSNNEDNFRGIDSLSNIEQPRAIESFPKSKSVRKSKWV